MFVFVCVRGGHFNSQPHKEADKGFRFDRKYRLISTHSLTRRLTFLFSAAMLSKDISTHSLTRRLTRYTYFLAPRVEFQLTASQGG